ncbi:HisA/HisF-related TIM barrel protein [Actinomadura fulvescens]|uniref:Imidazole glycerol phosphate synthase subunit HisF n=1 Tax=Actinomadura fulvescens TaxID=46160 RepID=A0ABN3Q2E2_9ACTN
MKEPQAPTAAPVVPCLEVHEGRTTEPSGIPGLTDPCDPVMICRHYRRQGVQTIMLDILDDWDRHERFVRLIKRVADLVPTLWVAVATGFAPSLRAAGALLGAGADMIGLSTTSVENPQVMREVADRHGSERVLGMMDVRRVGPGRWNVFIRGGTKRTGLDAITWADILVELGAGLLLPNSLDGEEGGEGYDIDLYQAIADTVQTPLIVGGGASTPEHLYDGLRQPHVLFAAVAKATHSGAMSITQAHDYLHERGLV